MGRMAILMVLGVTILIGAFTISLTNASSDAFRNAGMYYDYLNARSIAHSAVNVVLHQIDNGDTLTTAFSGSFDGGSYTVGKTQSNDSIRLAVRARFIDTVYAIDLLVQQYPKPFPKTNAAVGLSSDSVNFNFNGNPAIVGNDTNPDNTAGPGPGLPGITVPTKYDSASVNPYQNYITATPKIKVSDSIPDPSSYVDEYLNNSTNPLTGDLSGSQTIGSASNPAIVTRDGNLSISGSVTIYGILVVKGNLKLSGTVKIYGIVIVYGENIEVNIESSSGTPKVYGAFLMSGPAHSSFSMKGNGDYYYSSQTLGNVQRASSLRAYKVLEWWE
jgi:hypothetical protein